jgi:hypothetical protein
MRQRKASRAEAHLLWSIECWIVQITVIVIIEFSQQDSQLQLLNRGVFYIGALGFAAIDIAPDGFGLQIQWQNDASRTGIFLNVSSSRI